MTTAPVLIAYDGSPSARHAIEQAAAVLGPREALVVHVWDPVLPAPTGDPFGIGAGMVDPAQAQEVDRLVHRNAEAIAADGAQRARDAGLQAEPIAQQTHGSTWATILDVAHERGAAVVVVGARGHSKVRSFLLGSVSNGLIHHADLPVLVLPARHADDEPSE